MGSPFLFELNYYRYTHDGVSREKKEKERENKRRVPLTYTHPMPFMLASCSQPPPLPFVLRGSRLSFSLSLLLSPSLTHRVCNTQTGIHVCKRAGTGRERGRLRERPERKLATSSLPLLSSSLF